MGGCQQVAAVIAIRGPQNMQMLRAFYKKGGFPNTALSSESIFSGLLKPKNSLQAVAHQERMKEWKIDWIYIHDLWRAKLLGGTRSQPGHIVSVAKLDYRENISHALGLETQ